eukprot:TRINITY_DN3807_c2_g1_i4.p1 TRINITY_DN3807_c2_g1~~TRINITY_DN3807_c2_g1_i4.p1  ORF type:complete len:337 (+),score=94.11 TRINITY_DN3807_c2_g1_i4:76-1086(+)
MTAVVADPPVKPKGIDYSKFDKIEDSDDEKTPRTADPNTVTKQAEIEKPYCQNCRADVQKPLRCGVCKKVTYCSAKCQKEDWQFHKRNCKKPEPPKADKDKLKAPSTEDKERRQKEREQKKKEETVVDNDDEKLTWYRHREWKPSAEPKKEFKPEKLDSSSASDSSPAAAKPQAGSAWNAAGTWEDRDVTSFAKDSLTQRLGSQPELDVAGGVMSVVSVTDVEGDASKPVIRGKLRHMFDLSFKIKFAFKWMDSDGQGRAEGSINIQDFTNDTFTEGVLSAPQVTLSFKESAKTGSRQQAVEAALGSSAWPPAAGTFMAAVASSMQSWAKEYEETK